MSDIQTAVESIRRLAVQYQDMLVAADALESIGSVEQATREATAARAAAEDARDKALLELDAIVVHVQESKGEAEQIIAAAQKQANDIKDAALSNAQQAAEASKAVAAATVQDAEAKAAEALSGVSAQLSVLQAKLTELNDAVAAAEQAKADAEDATAAAQAKLDAIRDQIAKLVAA